jgi:hypothetical protein
MRRIHWAALVPLPASLFRTDNWPVDDPVKETLRKR